MEIKKLKNKKYKISNSWHSYEITIISESEFSVSGFSDYAFFFKDGKIECWNKTKSIKKTTLGKICLMSDETKRRTSINMHSFESLVKMCFKNNILG